MELQEKIKEFLQDPHRPRYQQLSDAFWMKTAYLADTLTLYEGPESNIVQCKDALDALMHKLEYRVVKMSKWALQQFPLLMKHSSGTVNASLRTEYIWHMKMLWEEIKSCFADVEEYLSKES